MKKLPFEKILALSPHTDDVEFGCGATLYRLLEQDSEIHVAVFSLCEESVPKGFAKEILLDEMTQSLQTLGIPKTNRHLFRYPVRRFSEHRQDILEDLVQLKKKINPDLTFVPATTDVHQDHQVICQEAIRAFRYQTILGYELPWNNITFSSQAVFEISAEGLATKAECLENYKSQQFRHYVHSEVFTSLAKLRGIMNQTKLSEAFEVIRFSL